MNDLFAQQLELLRARSLDRHLREIGTAQGPVVEINGEKFVNFSSNDYLGLANEPLLRQAAMAAIEKFGVGAGSSRLISGTQSPHVQLEHALAEWKGTEAALVFSSGYAAAVGTIPALVGSGDVVLLDKFCHASLIDGAKLSGATLRIFPHNRAGKLNHHLQWARDKYPNGRILVITESVFSMDGDRAPIREIVELKNAFRAMLMLDEAHAIGVVGPGGRGLAAEESVNDQVEIQMGTLSKSLGGSGGYICGSKTLIAWLVNRARSFIFTTAPPPAIAASAVAAIHFVSSKFGDERRRMIWRNIESLRSELPAKSQSAIFPWIIGDEKETLNLAANLRAQGFLVPAIRYPTVAKGKARLRITLTATHDGEQIHALAGAIKKLSGTSRRKLRGA